MMHTIRQSLVAKLTRLYPLYSGCGTFANTPFSQKLAGTSNEHVWPYVPSGEILAPLNDYFGRAAFYVGHLDHKITWICAQIVRPSDAVLDIGANIGMVKLWLSKLVGKSGIVHALEPNPELQNILEETLSHNQVSKVCLHPVTLGAEQGLLELRVPRDNAGAPSFFRNRDIGDCDVVSVPVQRLSKIVAEEEIESIHLIRVDGEDSESELSQGGQEVVSETRPEAILFQLNERLESSACD